MGSLKTIYRFSYWNTIEMQKICIIDMLFLHYFTVNYFLFKWLNLYINSVKKIGRTKRDKMQANLLVSKSRYDLIPNLPANPTLCVLDLMTLPWMCYLSCTGICHLLFSSSQHVDAFWHQDCGKSIKYLLAR